MSVCCECCVWSGRDLCDRLIIRPEESQWDCESSVMRRPWPTGGCCDMVNKSFFNMLFL